MRRRWTHLHYGRAGAGSASAARVPGRREDAWWQERPSALQPRHLVEGARDADDPGPEVDRHRSTFHLDDAAHSVGVVRHQLVYRELVYEWLRCGLERA